MLTKNIIDILFKIKSQNISQINCPLPSYLRNSNEFNSKYDKPNKKLKFQKVRPPKSSSELTFTGKEYFSFEIPNESGDIVTTYEEELILDFKTSRSTGLLAYAGKIKLACDGCVKISVENFIIFLF